jgi:hypothetical protein
MVLVFIVTNNLPLHLAHGARALPIGLAITCAAATAAGSSDSATNGESMACLPTEYEVNHILMPALKWFTLEQVREHLQDIDIFNITMDGWTAGHQIDTPHYNSFVVHFIDKQWELHGVALGAFHMKSKQQSGKMLRKFIKEALVADVLYQKPPSSTVLLRIAPATRPTRMKSCWGLMRTTSCSAFSTPFVW